MATISEKQQKLVDNFSMFDDWMDKYQYIIDLGAELPPFPESKKIDDNLFHGCQSQVWLVGEPQGNCLHLEAASDSAIVSGLIYLLLSLYNDQPAADILAHPPTFIHEIGLARHLSPNRSTGLAAMVTDIRNRAATIAATAE